MDSSEESTTNESPDEFGKMKDSETMIHIAPKSIDTSSMTSSDTDTSPGHQVRVSFELSK